MSTKQEMASYTPSIIRERIQDLSVDLEYASRSGDTQYSQHIEKRIQNLYKLLDRIASRGKRF